MTHTLRQALTVTALLLLALGGLFWSQAHSAATQDEIFSGPQVGEPTPSFTIIGSSGPYKDRSVDIIQEFGGGPVAIVFVNRPTRAAARTLRELDKGFAARFDQGLRAMFVLLSADQEQSERYGGQLLRSLNMSSDMGVSVDGLEGPGSYGLLKESMLTILIAKDNVVAANFALISPNETDAPPVMAAIDAMLAPDLSTPEGMRAELERLRKEMAALRSGPAADGPVGFERMAGMEGDRGMAGGRGMDDGMAGRGPGAGRNGGVRGGEAPTALGPLPGRAPNDPSLSWLLQAILRPGASPEVVQNAERLLGGYLDANPALVEEFLGAEALLVELGAVERNAQAALARLKQRFATQSR
jgi:hypothetical protein